MAECAEVRRTECHGSLFVTAVVAETRTVPGFFQNAPRHQRHAPPPATMTRPSCLAELGARAVQ